MELPFFITRYRLWGWTMFLVAGIATGVITLVLTSASLNLASMGLGLVIGVCVVQILSFTVCSLLSLAISRALIRAGVGGGPRRDTADV